jgi:hypothetical protein
MRIVFSRPIRIVDAPRRLSYRSKSTSRESKEDRLGTIAWESLIVVFMLA